MYQLLKKLTGVQGTSGSEKNIAATIRGMMEPRCDEIKTDALGNLICLKKGSGGKIAGKIMLCAHMDEIGFVATFIEKDGLIRIATVGGISFQAAAFSEVVFENGVRGVLVPDSEVPVSDWKADKFGVDIGASTAAEAGRRVKLGDRCALAGRVFRLGAHRVAGRPLDNRAGCAVLIDAARRMSEKRPSADVYFVFSVQEEVGLRGAGPAAFGIAPDVAVIFDVTRTGDTHGAKPMAVKLGGGAAVKIRDSSVICDAGTVERLAAAATENGIPFQYEVLVSGGTDTAAVQVSRGGVLAGAVSIPERYIHSGVEVIDLRDLSACADLAVALAGK